MIIEFVIIILFMVNAGVAIALYSINKELDMNEKAIKKHMEYIAELQEAVKELEERAYDR